MRIRKPRLKLTSKGIKLTNLGAYIGSRWAGLNISSRGLSGSIKTPLGSYNTRRGCWLNPLACCSVVALLPLAALGLLLLAAL